MLHVEIDELKHEGILKSYRTVYIHNGKDGLTIFNWGKIGPMSSGGGQCDHTVGKSEACEFHRTRKIQSKQKRGYKWLPFDRLTAEVDSVEELFDGADDSIGPILQKYRSFIETLDGAHARQNVVTENIERQKEIAAAALVEKQSSELVERIRRGRLINPHYGTWS